jgi:tetratricopeptide (TPR) repeat protein
LTRAEQQLAKDPRNITALKKLAAAARALDLPETVVFALEAVRELQPDDSQNLLALGAAWLELGDSKKALEVADAVLKAAPLEHRAQDLMKRASIAKTVTEGNWALTDSFRDKLRNAEKAAALEVGARIMTSEDWTERLIEEALLRVHEEPDNVQHYRNLVNGYRRLERFDEAIEWVEKARALPTAAADPSLERLEYELREEKLERSLKHAEETCAASPQDNAAIASRDEMERELQQFRLTSRKQFVERHPDDAAARRDLGFACLEAGEIELAIEQFQQAQRMPAVRVAALIGLGRAFKARKQFDLAVQQFTTAKRELGPMDERKKEIVYELGGCFLLMGEIDSAMAEYKSIYSEDVGYRDVAEKVDAYYSAR